MEKSEFSDSDSNSSSSWVLVYDNRSPLENVNAFHLDCSREPIQELTEQDLLSAGSDCESESDGISVISESEALHEGHIIKTCQETGDLLKENANIDNCETLSNQALTQKKCDKPLASDSKKIYKGSNIVGVSVVLTAVFLGSYTLIVQKNSAEDIGDLHDLFVYNDAKIDSNVLCKTDLGVDNQLEEIVDMTIACTYGKQDQNVMKNKEIKQCVKVQYETKRFENEVQTHDSIEKDNEARIIDVTTKEMQKTLTNRIKLVHSQNYKKEVLYLGRTTGQEQNFKGADLDFFQSNNKTKKYAKHKRGEKVLKDKYKNKKWAEKQKPSEKFDESEYKRANSRKVYRNKFENSKRSYEVKFKHKYFIKPKKNSTEKDLKGVVKSGEWYSNWHKARQQLRKHSLIDDHYINKKRSKMQWYFKWMDGREELRYKKSYRPYST